MLQFDLSAQERKSFGKGASRSLRSKGKTPAILYGSKTEPVALSLDAKELRKALLQIQGSNAVFSIDVDSDSAAHKRHVMVKEVQSHPVTNSLVHADFCEVSLDQPIILEVPVTYTGVAKGVELGGEMTVNLSTVTVKGLVLDIPDSFVVDVTSLVNGASLTCAILEVAGNVEVLNDKDAVCVSVHLPKRVALLEGEDEETAGEAEAAGAPEGSGEAVAE